MATKAYTQAQNKSDVDKMTSEQRLWDSLNYSYGQQRKASDESFNNTISQADRQALGRGMQRSSYNNATLANLRNKQVEAQNNIWSQQIADYENRRYQLDRDAKADEQWERQFGENQRQFNENLGFQKERANVQDTQWQKQFDESTRQWQSQFDEGNRQWQAQFDKGNEQWDKQFAESTRQFNAQLGNNWMQRMIEMGTQPSDELLAQIGLSRADYNAMVQQIESGGGGGGGGSEPVKKSSGKSSGGNNTNGNQSDPFGNAVGYNTGSTNGSGTFAKISGKAIDIGKPVSSTSNYSTSNSSTGNTNSYLGSKKDKVKK